MHRKLLAILSCCTLLVFNNSVSAQESLPTDYLSKDFHKGRREAARALMPDNSVMVVFAAPTRNYANDVDYNYHQNPDLYYFTGYKEPNAVLFLFKNNQKQADGKEFNELFFVRPKNELAERWEGRRLGEQGVKEKLGITNVESSVNLVSYNLDLSPFSKVLIYTPEEIPAGREKDTVGKTTGLYAQLLQLKDAYKNNGTQNNIKLDTRTYRSITGQLRVIKTPEELTLLRKAVEISCQGQNEVMKAIRPNMSELEIQGLHEYIHKRYGAESVGYGSIVGSGANGCILHYVENSKTRIGNEMLLMDVGAEYHGYTADVTRTIPADGKFSAEEKAIYQIVYDAQEAAFKTLKNGSTWGAASNAARKTIAQGLIKLGIIKEEKEANQYYPHGLGHHIGLDVHDRGPLDTLKKNMVVTIEPGIYIPPNSKCDKKWWNIAVRIEDDALIRENDYELLSRSAPRSIADIEKMIAEKSAIDNYTLPALPSATKKAF
jgi:Xaa-Pro aminopeptidase